MDDKEIIVYDTLKAYGLKSAKIEMLGHSDKLVYKVITDNDKAFVLSIYLPRTEYPAEYQDLYFHYDKISAEIKLLIDIRKLSSIAVPEPIVNNKGEYVTTHKRNDIDKNLYCVLTKFIYGSPMDDKSENYHSHAYYAGQTAAKLHDFSEKYSMSEKIKRSVQDQIFLDSIVNKIHSGVEASVITEEQYVIIEQGKDFIKRCMNILDLKPATKGIIHTDLRAANFIMQGETAIPIDFSRFVYGYFLYDLGEMCAHMGGADIQKQILLGYKSIRELTYQDIVCVEGFFVMFLFIVLSEFIRNTNSYSWLKSTIASICNDYIPNLLNGRPVFKTAREILY